MATIYEPGYGFSVRDAVGGAFKQAALLAAVDFVAEAGKPWSFYVGVGFGAAALATGIPGAAAALYVLGDTLDYYIFKSPQGGELRVFLNGVQLTSLDTYAAVGAWELVQGLVLASNQRNEVLFVNHSASPSNTSGILWAGLGPVTVRGGAEIVERGSANPVAYNTVTFRIKDGEADNRLGSLPIRVPSTVPVVAVQAFVNAIAPEIDALTEGRLMSADVTLTLDLPAGLKSAPVATSLNERGGLLAMDTSLQRNDSLWIPAFSRTLMPGDQFSIAAAAVAALIARLTTAQTYAGTEFRPRTANDAEFLAAISGRKALRRQG